MSKNILHELDIRARLTHSRRERMSKAVAAEIRKPSFDLLPELIHIIDRYILSFKLQAVALVLFEFPFPFAQIGKCFYIFERFTFEVIGFAEGGRVFYSSGDRMPVSYDRYIIMPFASISEDSEISRIILLQQICGLITDGDGRQEALKSIFITTGFTLPPHIKA